jgi:tRNA (adenine22-N1)-methyltransferase
VNGRPRRDVIVGLLPPGRLVIDVGADHGYVAQAVGGIATERQPHRRGDAPVRWVVADGLRPFRNVDVAVIAGMGAYTIARILGDVPKPNVVVLHPQDDPPRLRRWLAANGWRIDAEALAPEAGRFAEVIRAVPGHEPHDGAVLELGPVLLDGDDPHLDAHLAELDAWLTGLFDATRDHPAAHAPVAARLARVREVRGRRG